MIQPIMKQISASKKSEKLADLCNLDFTRLHGKKNCFLCEGCGEVIDININTTKKE